MKPWEIIAEDLSKARRAGHLVAIKNDSGAILNGSASEIR
jgi:hypothetical protein